MDSTQVSIEVLGTWCNDWPKFRVIGNNNIYYDNEIVGTKVITFSMPLQESNSLILEHYGKYFGQNNRWDTQSENNVIVQDRGVRLVHLELDEVDIVKYVFGNWPYVTDQGESFPTNYFGHNGKCTVNFDAPVYPWIIANLVRTTASTAQKPQDFVIETSHNDLFNYSQDIDIIEEIENILEEHAHLFDKSSQV